jgi:hypothetical protein
MGNYFASAKFYQTGGGSQLVSPSGGQRLTRSGEGQRGSPFVSLLSATCYQPGRESWAGPRMRQAQPARTAILGPLFRAIFLNHRDGLSDRRQSLGMRVPEHHSSALLRFSRARLARGLFTSRTPDEESYWLDWVGTFLELSNGGHSSSIPFARLGRDDLFASGARSLVLQRPWNEPSRNLSHRRPGRSR